MKNFIEKFNDINLKLDALRKSQDKFNKTSKEYQSLLKLEIDLLNKNKQLLEEQVKQLDGNNVCCGKDNSKLAKLHPSETILNNKDTEELLKSVNVAKEQLKSNSNPITFNVNIEKVDSEKYVQEIINALQNLKQRNLKF